VRSLEPPRAVEIKRGADLPRVRFVGLEQVSSQPGEPWNRVHAHNQRKACGGDVVGQHLGSHSVNTSP
jgi:hypothetical protein